MAVPRLATFAVNGTIKYGAVVDNGVIDLSARHASGQGAQTPARRSPPAPRTQ